MGIFRQAIEWIIDQFIDPKKVKETELDIEIKNEPIYFKQHKIILCPYCNYRFDEMPKRNRKCPNCKEYIYRVKDYENKIYRLITVKQYEQEAQMEANKQWAELNQQVAELAKSRDWDGLSYTYYQMALQLQEEGKEFFHLLQESAKFKLRHERSRGVEYVSISGAGKSSCLECQKLSGKVFSIQDALKEMPLPCVNCSFDLHGSSLKHGFCRCVYVPQIIINGKSII